MKNLRWLVIIFVLSLPSFSLLVQPGIFTMHDFHVFRQHQFLQCVSEGFFPCRWSADSSHGFGQPLFVFYTQAPYWLGQLVISLFSWQIIDAVKFSFAASLLLSGLAAFAYARRHWGDAGGLLSAVLYIYAPYRAVDVWVRGALPESLGFVWYPLILLFIEKYLQTHRFKYLLLVSVSVSALVTMHNLSALMFLPFAAVWTGRLWSGTSHQFRSLLGLAGAGLFSLALSAYYLLPVVFESTLTRVGFITGGYYDYGIHFTTLYRLFVSDYWGYGGSIWGPNQYMSFSVGYLHWIIPILAVMILLVKKLNRSLGHLELGLVKIFSLFCLLGLFALFLTHGKSVFIWQLVPGLSFVQFPWRFLSIAVFFLSLAAGFLPKILPFRLIPAVIVAVAILLNYHQFRPDIWRPVDDAAQFSGTLWAEQRASAVGDYWPKAYPVPAQPWPQAFPQIESGSARINSWLNRGGLVKLSITVTSDLTRITLPVVSFAGWQSNYSLVPDPASGLLTTVLDSGDHEISLRFVDTWSRSVGNSVSQISVVLLICYLAVALVKPRHA